MSVHSVEAIVTMLGIEIPVEVEINLTSSGTAASWDDPGDAPEFEINSILCQSNGDDITNFCSRTFDYEYSGRWFYSTFSNDENWQDPIRIVMFGLGKDYYSNRKLKSQLYNALPTLYDSLRNWIMEHKINDILYDLSQEYYEG